jgi:hypothetical protein
MLKIGEIDSANRVGPTSGEDSAEYCEDAKEQKPRVAKLRSAIRPRRGLQDACKLRE